MTPLNNSEDGFTIVEVIIVAFIIIVIGLVFWLITLPQTNAQFSKHFRGQANSAATDIKSLTEHIGIDANVLANHGNNQGCRIEMKN